MWVLDFMRKELRYHLMNNLKVTIDKNQPGKVIDFQIDANGLPEFKVQLENGKIFTYKDSNGVYHEYVPRNRLDIHNG